MTAEQLRNSILQEAISGRLVPQDPNDEPASALLARIREEKARLVKEGKLKKKDLVETPITDEEKPFEIPSSWAWVRWGNLAFSIMYGYNAPAEDNGDIRMVRISDIQDNKVLWDKVPFCKIKPSDIETYLLKPNDILFARTGGTVGKSYIVNDVPYPSIYAGYLIRTQYSEQLCPNYLKYFMESRLYWAQLRDETIATAQPNCNGKKLAAMMLPLPPLPEQKRIVAKLEELLPIVEQYGKAQTELDELNAALPNRLRQSILQEAISGRLVPQDPNDEPASVLLQRIREEKERLVKEGKLKKKDLVETPIKEEEIPFEIPASWEWVRLGYLVDFSKSSSVKASSISPNAWILDLEDIQKNTGVLLRKKHMGETVSISDKHQFKKGNVLYSKLRPYLNKVIVADEDGYCTSEILCFNFGEINNRYAQLFLMSAFFVDYAMKDAYGVKMPRLGSQQGNNALFPLPPLAEQQRIVAKIEELLADINKISK